jgi:light-regulated signal transduction histidine kinase (bacteriophytochrome)
MNSESANSINMDQKWANVSGIPESEITSASNNIKIYEDLKERINTLEEKIDSIKFFTYSISHDLKSPATSLYGITKRLQDKCEESLDEKSKACFTQILKTTEHIVALVDNMNAYIATKETPISFEKIEVKEITKSIKNEFATELKQRNIRWLEPETIPELNANRMAILRVFRNFADNALKYGGEELHEIRIGYRENKDFHILSFSDDGVGIDEEDNVNIFEIFQRDGTSIGMPGSGMGLAIVKEAGARHQGGAWMANNESKGITFYISISKHLELTD